MAQVGDTYVLGHGDTISYVLKIINVNDFREPNMKYAVDVTNSVGLYLEDLVFVGDEFLEKCIKIND